MIVGYIDRFDNYIVRGWCFDKDSLKRTVEVSFFIDGNFIVSKKADLFRPDLLTKNHPSGNCGFMIEIPHDIQYCGQKIEVFCEGIKLKSRYPPFLIINGNGLVSRVQIYGERASGTNFLEHLLINNLPAVAHTNQYGWKHFFPPNDFPGSDNCLFLVIYRDPFDWIRSLHLQPHHVHPSLKKIPFSDFIRKEWHCIFDEVAGVKPDDEEYSKEMMFERDPATGNRFENVLQLRTAKIEAFEALKEKVKYIRYIRYEDLKQNPVKFIGELSNQYHLNLMPEFEPVEKYKGITDKPFVSKTYFPISTDDLNFIKKNLNIQVEKNIGYHIFNRYVELLEQNGKISLWNKLVLKVKAYFCW